MARLTISDLEIERNDDPFEVEMSDGEVYRLVDPRAIHATVLVTLDSMKPDQQLRTIAGDRGDELLARPDVDGYFLEALMRRYRQHYGIGSPPESDASPRS